MSSSIPIALATDENYAPYVYTTMLSCLESKNESSYYEFYIMVPEQFRSAYVSEFMRLSLLYSGCSVRFINMKGLFQEANISIAHIATPTYYRLVMASMLNHCDKAIYLDSDVIVKADLTEYFAQDLTDYCVGGVKAIGYILNKPLFPYYKGLGLDSVEGYINAGVTIWNLQKIRALNLEPTLLSMAAKGLKSMDQDVINIAFKDKIKVLPLKYNMMTKYMAQFTNLEKNPAYVQVYGKENIKEAIEQPVIIHYADKIKPWQDSKMPFAADWWKVARHLPFIFQHVITTQCVIKQLDSICNINASNAANKYKEICVELSNLRSDLELCASYKKLLQRYRMSKIKAVFSWGKRRDKWLEKKKKLHNLIRKCRNISQTHETSRNTI